VALFLEGKVQEAESKSCLVQAVKGQSEVWR
jgi:hypothetical protein